MDSTGRAEFACSTFSCCIIPLVLAAAADKLFMPLTRTLSSVME